MTYSKTFLSVIVLVVTEVLKLAGISVGGEEVMITTLTLFQIGSGALILWERFKKGGVNVWGVKK